MRSRVLKNGLLAVAALIPPTEDNIVAELHLIHEVKCQSYVIGLNVKQVAVLKSWLKRRPIDGNTGEEDNLNRIMLWIGDLMGVLTISDQDIRTIGWLVNEATTPIQGAVFVQPRIGSN